MEGHKSTDRKDTEVMKDGKESDTEALIQVKKDEDGSNDKGNKLKKKKK